MSNEESEQYKKVIIRNAFNEGILDALFAGVVSSGMVHYVCKSSSFFLNLATCGTSGKVATVAMTSLAAFTSTLYNKRKKCVLIN